MYKLKGKKTTDNMNKGLVTLKWINTLQWQNKSKGLKRKMN